MSTENSQYSFAVSDGARLKVKNIRGVVTVEPGDDGLIEVAATKHLDSGSAERTTIDVSQDSDGLVTAQVKVKEGVIGFLTTSKPCRVDLAIKVPVQCDVEIGIVSCDLTAGGITGTFKLDTVSGDAVLKDLNGSLLFNTVSGDITGQQLSGNLDLKAVSGDVSLTGSSFPTIHGKTVSGDLKLETALSEGPYKFNSVSGNMVLTIPEDTPATAKLSSISGRIKAPSGTVKKDAKSPGAIRQTAVLNGGGTTVAFNSVSGDLHLIGPADMETEPEESMVNTSTVSRSEILEQIAQGTLSVDEGISQLQKSN